MTPARHPAPLWNAREAAAVTHGRAVGTWSATGISIDSRTAGSGDLFVALQGPNFDGHDYVAAALAAGCAAAAVARVPEGVAEDAPLLIVADTFAALNDLGAAARKRTDARIVAVTGSVGKTGVKEALTALLSAQGKTHGTTGNLNNQWGVPLSLARMPRETKYGVFEIGMNRPGEIAPLSRLVAPDVGIITTVSAVHLEFFESVSHIAEAKAELFAGLAGGTAVLNRDNPFFALLSVAADTAGVDRIIAFGAHPEATSRLLDYHPEARGSRVRANIEGRELDYRLGLPGRHSAINSLAVLAAVNALGADVGCAAEALAALAPHAGRGARHDVRTADGVFLLIDDSYNASPASVRAALETLGTTEPGKGGRRLAALGDMLELGGGANRLHAGLAEAARTFEIDQVYTAGPLMAHLHEALPAQRRGQHAEDSAALAAILRQEVHAGDVVLVKGSLGSRMRLVVDALLEMGLSPRKAANGE